MNQKRVGTAANLKKFTTKNQYMHLWFTEQR